MHLEGMKSFDFGWSYIIWGCFVLSKGAEQPNHPQGSPS
jgi:hypothetical protein